MWMHPDVTQDEQCNSKKSKSKGRSCNVVSVLSDDDNVTIASFSDSKNKRYAFTTQADVPQPTGTRSEKSYLKQYDKTTDKIQQQTTSVEVPVPASVPTSGKEKQKEVRFDRVLKKPSGPRLDVPFRFDILPSWLIFQLVSPYTRCFAS